MKYTIHTILCLSLVFLAACSNTIVEPLVCEIAVVDEPITIQEGTLVCLPEGESIEILEISNELCPCFVFCISPGTIKYSLNMTLLDGSTVPGQMFTDTLMNETIMATMDGDTLAYRFTTAEIEFEEECTETNGSPDILKTQLTLIR